MKRFHFAAVAALCGSALLVACGGGDEDFQGGPPGGGGPPTLPPPASAPALKTVLAAKYGKVGFPIGAAIEAVFTVAGSPDAALLLKHFSSITAENAMKPQTIWPNLAGSATQPAAAPNFAAADVIYNFGLT